MKIAILTQRLFTNYGGLMQSYALQTILERMGHKVLILDREYNDKEMFSLISRVKSKVRRAISNVVRFIQGRRMQFDISKEDNNHVRQNTNPFIRKYHHASPKIYTAQSLKQTAQTWNADAYVVGSDQVWRPVYSPMISNYFLDFTEGWNVKRISYAASFGVDNWEYSDHDTVVCRDLLKQFNAISVREDSGIKLCKDHLNADAKMVLDPTMLLNKEDYENLVVAENEPKSQGNLFCYILDMNAEKEEVIREIESQYNLKFFNCMPELPLTYNNVKLYPEKCVFPRVTKWLRAFMDAEMVFTDSFHGMVFSIIFNKPFWVLINAQRGSARFTSLLKLLSLDDRIISISNKTNVDWSKPIDWNEVNNRLANEKRNSLDFLINALS